MRYTINHQCGHTSAQPITGRDRAGRIAQAEATDCFNCRATAHNRAVHEAATSEGRPVRTRDLMPERRTHDGVAIHVNYNGTHYAPYPGGGLWYTPGVEITVDGVVASVTPYQYRSDGWIIPDEGEIATLVADALEQAGRSAA